MFEIPDDDDNFWNDEPLEENILIKPGSLSGKENRPQLRVPDSACTGNAAKRLCTDFSRDVTSPVQAEINKEFPQLRNVISASHHSNSLEGNKTIPDLQQNGSTVVNVSTGNVTSAQGNSTVLNSVQANEPAPKCINTATFSDVAFPIPFPTDALPSHDNGRSNFKGANTHSFAKDTGGLGASMSSSNMNNSGICNVKNDTNLLKQNSFQSDAYEAHPNKEPANIQNETYSTSGSIKRRSFENKAGDHVTPQRKRKFPGPAGILPKLGQGRNFDVMSPTSLNTTTPVSNKSPKDDNVILCSQQTDDVFNDLPWQKLITDLGEEGQTLLKKFSISSTLLKSGKKQLIQGKAVLIFGIIESIESHGSEASVTIRDRSGRMQGTIHRDLLKDHEADLQAGTVLVLKQVSIISLSNRNHYLNITPSNIVVLYRGGEGSLRSLKFHGSEDSLHSVLSALEKKAATQNNSLNSSVTMTPSSHTGSGRFGSNSGTPQQFGVSPLTEQGTGTPQRYGASHISPGTNQRLFSPQTPVTAQSPNVRTPTPLGVRNVSVVDRNTDHVNQTKNNFRPNFKNINSPSRLNTPCVSDSNSTFFSTPNTDFTMIPVQNNTHLYHDNSNVNTPNSNHAKGNNLGNSSTGPWQTNNFTQNQNTVTPSSVGQSRWKFKSPGRNSSLLYSPDISKIPGNTANTSVNSRIPSVKGFNSSTDTGAVKSVEGTGTYGNQTCIIKSTASVGGSAMNNIGQSSVWSFKKNNNFQNGKENLPGQTDKPGTGASEENLWEDDMDDDILSQLSEDFT